MTFRFVETVVLDGVSVVVDGDQPERLEAWVNCARTGCQTYTRDSIGLEGAGTIEVYRPPEAVFARDSLATYAAAPVTLQHPPEMVDKANWKDYAVGEVGDEVARDGEVIRVGIRVRDAAAINAIQDGTRQISMGYTTPISVEDGVAPDGTAYGAIQTGPIKINHLAIVDRARGGSNLRIGDSDANGREPWGAAPHIVNDTQEAEVPDPKLSPVVIGDEVANVLATDMAKLEAFKVAQAKALADAATAHAEAIAAKDGEVGALKAKLAEAEDKIPDQAALDAMVTERADMVAKARAVFPALDAAGKSAEAIRRAVVAHKMGDEAVKDASDAEISGMFKVVSATVGDAALKTISTVAATDAAVPDVAKIIAARDAAMGRGWKDQEAFK